MPNIEATLNYPIANGLPVTFKSPADCSQVTGLVVCYPEGGTTKSKTFQFADAHGNNVGDIDLFAENVLVKVILDVDASRAYVQNADTNAYLEGRFKALEDKVIPLTESTEYPTCYYMEVNGEKRWLNPPAVGGVEYRLLDFHEAAPVYQQTINIGYLAAGTHEIAHNIPRIGVPISADVINNGQDLVTGSENIPRVVVTRTLIHLTTKVNHGHIAVLIRYSKA